MKYKPISCSLYDKLEHSAITHKILKIAFSPEDQIDETIYGSIDNIYSKNSQEFLIINKLHIRLDKIKLISDFEDSNE